jgi:hypothetical protein
VLLLQAFRYTLPLHREQDGNRLSDQLGMIPQCLQKKASRSDREV